MKYILYIDYKTHCKSPENLGWEYRPLEAKNFREAINEAEKIYNAETMYLVQIMEKEGKVYSENDYKVQVYTAIECKRSCEGGWHANTAEECEGEHRVRRCYMTMNKKVIDWYD